MEVDIPQVNGFSIQQPSPSFVVGNGSGGNHVQFNSIAEVKLIEQRQSSLTAPQQGVVQPPRPKHKARRRARVPKLDISDGSDPSNVLDGEMPKPLSPSKLKKMMEKDRHSRTGRRGVPKKGNKKAFLLMHVVIIMSCNIIYVHIILYHVRHLPVHVAV